MKLTLDTFIISDTHFSHDNIVKYCDRPENHDEIMERNWWRNVSIDDNILHLGDIMHWRLSNAESIVRRLPGNKFLIKGNHDGKRNLFYEDLGFTIMPRRVYMDHMGKKVLFTHYPETRLDIQWDINIHGHIHNNSYVTRKRHGRKYINVSVEVMNYTPVRLRDILCDKEDMIL